MMCSSRAERGEQLNNVSIVGRLTKNPELRQISDTTNVTSFTLAVNRSFKNQAGENQADFIQCNAWGKLAQHVVQYCGKGSLVGVSGRLQSRTYMNNEEKRIYITDVYAEEVKFLQLKNPTTSVDDMTDFVIPAALMERQK